jgi:hypothetical protein
MSISLLLQMGLYTSNSFMMFGCEEMEIRINVLSVEARVGVL